MFDSPTCPHCQEVITKSLPPVPLIREALEAQGRGVRVAAGAGHGR